MAAIRVFVIDDHAILREGLKRIVGIDERLIVSGEAENLPTALKLLDGMDWEVDVILVDMAMPGGSGLDFLKEARLIRPKIPVIVLSMYSEDQYAARVLKAGAFGYISKEAAPDELIEAIIRVNEGRKYISPTQAENIVNSVLSTGDQPDHTLLSNREFEVFKMIGAGQTVSEIAIKLSLSIKTISTVRGRILIKMNMTVNSEMMKYVIKEGLSDIK